MHDGGVLINVLGRLQVIPDTTNFFSIIMSNNLIEIHILIFDFNSFFLSFYCNIFTNDQNKFKKRQLHA